MVQIPGRRELSAACMAAVAAADPAAAVERALSVDAGVLMVGERQLGHFNPNRIVVIGIGKAAPAMASAVASLTGATRGIVVTPYEATTVFPLVVGGHPIPDQSSVAAGEALVELASTVRADDCVLAVVSGGGSAAAELPVAGVTLDALEEMNRALVRSAVPIEAINELRAAVSALKAGGLRERLGPATVATLVLSDIANGGVQVVSSGPTVTSDLGRRGREVIERFHLRSKLPACVVEAIESTPRRRGRRWSGDLVVEVASPSIAADAAARVLNEGGYPTELSPLPISGDVSTAVESLLDAAKHSTVVAAGEATVDVHGSGQGGRNQHAALIASGRIVGSGRRFAAFGTDGVDGATDAAGAIVDGTTSLRASDLGFDVSHALARFDSHPVLTATGDTIVTGPTGTNVADVWIATPDER